MRLISALYALSETQAVPPAGPGSKLAVVVPSLFPFAAHPIAAVRLAVWSTLRRLVLGEGARAWIDAVAAPALRLLFQAILLEEDEETAAAAEEAWREVLGVAGRAARRRLWRSTRRRGVRRRRPSAFDRIPGFFVVNLGVGTPPVRTSARSVQRTDWDTIGRLARWTRCRAWRRCSSAGTRPSPRRRRRSSRRRWFASWHPPLLRGA